MAWMLFLSTVATVSSGYWRAEHPWDLQEEPQTRAVIGRSEALIAFFGEEWYGRCNSSYIKCRESGDATMYGHL